MNSGQRKGIYFDLDTEALKAHYPKNDWHNAYYDVRNFLEKNGFEHIQGSGYHSIRPMSESKAMVVIHKMTKEFSRLNYCVSVCTISDVPETYDITYVFSREARWLEVVKQDKCD
ncbi:MAG: hypothetical protein LUF92_01605 [Clostridiales bacterium]|nr:hypothetical protein [Clostridiales bacterium]